MELYLADPKRNATQAYISAGYAERSAGQEVHKLLKDPDFQEELAAFAMEMVEGFDFDGEDVIKELAKVAFSPIIPGVIRASDKTKALELLGQHFKLWQGSAGSRTVNIQMLDIDLMTM